MPPATLESDRATATALPAFMAGARDTIPMLIGAAPFGVVFGSMAGASLLPAWQGQLMSLLVFAGASQFIAMGFLAAHTGIALILLATLVVNLRHSLYAAALLPQVAKLSLTWRLALGFVLTDETFAVVDRYYLRHPQAADGRWYFLGSGCTMYLNWQFWTLAGLLFGAAFPRLQTLGLDFAMVVTFIAIVVPNLRRAAALVAALTAAALAYVLRDLPFKGGLMIAVLAGVGLGTVLTYARVRLHGRSAAS